MFADCPLAEQQAQRQLTLELRQIESQERSNQEHLLPRLSLNLTACAVCIARLKQPGNISDSQWPRSACLRLWLTHPKQCQQHHSTNLARCRNLAPCRNPRHGFARSIAVLKKARAEATESTNPTSNDPRLPSAIFGLAAGPKVSGRHAHSTLTKDDMISPARTARPTSMHILTAKAKSGSRVRRAEVVNSCIRAEEAEEAEGANVRTCVRESVGEGMPGQANQRQTKLRTQRRQHQGFTHSHNAQPQT